MSLRERRKRIRNNQFATFVYPMLAWNWAVHHHAYGELGRGRTATKTGARLAAWRVLWFRPLPDSARNPR